MSQARTLLATLLVSLSQLSMAAPSVGPLEEVATLPIRPGNVTATRDGRVFATVHPLDKPAGLQLIEITAPNRYHAWPDSSVQSEAGNKSEGRLDTPLGIAQDTRGRLWVTDMGLNLGKSRIWGFDIASGQVRHTLELPSEIAPKGAFVQDLAVDAEKGWIYLAVIAPHFAVVTRIAPPDIDHPALIATDQTPLVVPGHFRQMEAAVLGQIGRLLRRSGACQIVRTGVQQGTYFDEGTRDIARRRIAKAQGDIDPAGNEIHSMVTDRQFQVEMGVSIQQTG